MQLSENMVYIRWTIKQLPQRILSNILAKYHNAIVCIQSLTYNHHMDQSYACDVLLEPIIWIVDNFTGFLGPFFVGAVAVLTTAVVVIAHWVGLPYYWEKSEIATIILVVFGYWLLINNVFHYYMAVVTTPGVPPEKQLYEAISICKKCLTPKPSRTHHCSVCNMCILKMDHHCPWLNNCVGFRNHRYFFMYMVYTTIGSFFLIVFGIEIAYQYVWLMCDEDFDALEGHPIGFNSTGHIIPLKEINIDYESHESNQIENSWGRYRRNAIIGMAVINVGVVLALGTLIYRHAKLIMCGETSIEAHINDSERERLRKLGKTFRNPYDFNGIRNFEIFLGLANGRTFWRHILFPSTHKPDGDGLTFQTIYSQSPNHWA